MEEMKLELNSNIFFKKELFGSICTVISIHPAFQMGRKEVEYTLMIAGVKMKLPLSQIRRWFTDKKSAEPTTNEACHTKLKKEVVEILKGSLSRNPTVKNLKETISDIEYEVSKVVRDGIDEVTKENDEYRKAIKDDEYLIRVKKSLSKDDPKIRMATKEEEEKERSVKEVVEAAMKPIIESEMNEIERVKLKKGRKTNAKK